MHSAALPDDAEEIVRLAGVMFASMGHALDQPGWPESGIQAVRERLGEDVIVFVVDDPDQPRRLAVSAAGSLHRRLPRPGAPDVVVAYVQWVATDEASRRRGLAAEAMLALLDWFHDRGVQAVELHATPMDETLCRDMGFSDTGLRAMRIRSLTDWGQQRHWADLT